MLATTVYCDCPGWLNQRERGLKNGNIGMVERTIFEKLVQTFGHDPKLEGNILKLKIPLINFACYNHPSLQFH